VDLLEVGGRGYLEDISEGRKRDSDVLTPKIIDKIARIFISRPE
jgi:hypothetical protein